MRETGAIKHVKLSMFFGLAYLTFENLKLISLIPMEMNSKLDQIYFMPSLSHFVANCSTSDSPVIKQQVIHNTEK